MGKNLNSYFYRSPTYSLKVIILLLIFCTSDLSSTVLCTKKKKKRKGKENESLEWPKSRTMTTATVSENMK